MSVQIRRMQTTLHRGGKLWENQDAEVGYGVNANVFNVLTLAMVKVSTTVHRHQLLQPCLNKKKQPCPRQGTTTTEEPGTGTSEATAGSITIAAEETDKVGSDDMPHDIVITEPLK